MKNIGNDPPARFLMGTILLVIGKRAKRARRHLLMSMESRDIYIFRYVRLFLIPMRA